MHALPIWYCPRQKDFPSSLISSSVLAFIGLLPTTGTLRALYGSLRAQWQSIWSELNFDHLFSVNQQNNGSPDDTMKFQCPSVLQCIQSIPAEILWTFMFMKMKLFVVSINNTHCKDILLVTYFRSTSLGYGWRRYGSHMVTLQEYLQATWSEAFFCYCFLRSLCMMPLLLAVLSSIELHLSFCWFEDFWLSTALSIGILCG